MELFRLVPTGAAFLSFFLTSCVFVYCDLPVKCIAISVAFDVFLVMRIAKLRIYPRIFRGKSDNFGRCVEAALCACIVAGIYSCAIFNVYYGRFSDFAGRTDTARVRIESTDYSLSYMARYYAIVTESELIPKNTRILLTSEQIGLEDGTILEGDISYSALSDSSSGGFDAEKYYLSKRIMLTAEDEALREIGTDDTFRITGLFRRLNKKLTTRILAHTKRDNGGISAAVLLGNREYLPDKISRDFRRLGVSHLLVVSGTHFSVLLTLASRFMVYMRIGRRKRAVISIGLICFFMALTGFSGSVLRAGIMYLTAQLAMLANRRVNYLHSLAFAGAAIVLFNPYAAFDCGLQLSFAAAYSCLLYNSLRVMVYRIRREKRKNSGKPRKVYGKKNFTVRLLSNGANVIGLTVVVNVTILPLTWLYFGEFSLLSVPANIVFIPTVTILMYITGIYLLLYPIGIFTVFLGRIIDLYCTVMLCLAKYPSSLENVMIPINYDFTVLFLIPLTVMLVLLPFSSRKGIKRLSIGIFTVLFAFFVCVGVVQMTEKSNVYFSYITTKTKNDGFVLKSDGKVLLCDISDGSYGYLSALTEEMTGLHSCEAEALLLTHYHNKHISYLERLCGREILRTLVLPEPVDERESGIYRSLCATANREGTEVVTVCAGEWYEFGETKILVHERTYLSRSTHPITAVSVVANGDMTTILSCSFNQGGEDISDYAESSDYLIFGHHSPVYKKTFDLSLKNEPKTVIISAPALEYMTEETLTRIGKANAIFEPSVWRVRLK